jgi:hypothetical protein
VLQDQKHSALQIISSLNKIHLYNISFLQREGISENIEEKGILIHLFTSPNEL